MAKILRSLSFFLGFLLSFITTNAQDTNALIEHIKQLQQTVQNRRLSTTELRNDQPHELPIGLSGPKDGQPPILIDEIKMYPDYAEFKAYAVLTMPGSDKDIYFATVNPVKLSFGGGIYSEARIALVKDQLIPMFGDDTEFVVKKNISYIEFDCFGFKKAGLGVQLNMSRKLVKENSDGTQNVDDQVKGNFSVEFSNLNDIIATVNLEPFQIKGINGVSITVKDAVIDLSDYNNNAGMNFPTGYKDTYFAGVDASLWRGFYIKSLSVKLPPELKDRSSNGRKELEGKDVLIDNHGFSGEIIGKNIIKLQDGDLGGWSYSVDEIGVSITANQFKGASLGGSVNIPITGDTTKLAYKAIFNPGKEYIFNVSTTKKVKFEVFKASNVELDKGSSVMVALINGKFKAQANLSGRMSIGAPLSDKPSSDSTASSFNAKDIKFEQLVISTDAPYIHSGVFDLSITAKLGNFSVGLSAIKIVKKDDSRGLGFDLKIAMMGAKDKTNGFSADASLMILGKVTISTDNRQRYSYKTTNLQRIHIKIDQGPYSLDGELAFFKDDVVFGNGFRGHLTVKLPPNITISATALFGKVGENNYWYADGLAKFSPGIPVAPALEINGFGGGLYYGVKQKAGAETNPDISQTGLSYVPDENVGLGVRASVLFASQGNSSVFNGNVGLEVTFNRGGGLSRIRLMGNANFLEALKDVSITATVKVGSFEFTKVISSDQNNSASYDKMFPKGALAASVLIDYDIDNKRFFANFKAYINVLGGVLKGVGPGGLAGEGVIYFAPDGWYIHIGTPTQPIGVQLAGLAKLTSYFMVGKNLPASPPPPKNVSEILGGKDLDYMRDLNALGLGKGIAFGAGLNFDTGNLSFLIFYARFAAGAGFDVMLKDYGSSAQCSTGGIIGINGWYANGQVYAYIQGKVGIQVKLFTKRKKFEIIDLGVAAILQAKLPNPTWMRGIVGGRYSILGGVIKGSCRFEFVLGKECEIINPDAFAESGLQVIADITPKTNDHDVDVFVSPQAVFNLPIGQSFSFSEASGKSTQFRPKLEEFSVKDGQAIIPGKTEWNSEHTTLVYITDDALPSKKQITVTARITFEENTNGSWKAYIADGKVYQEEMSHSFTSGTAPDYIPPTNIAYTYPIIRQLNYYQDESKLGYIKLKKGQAYLFNQPDADQVGRLLSNGTTKEMPVSYSAGTNQVNFSMPDIDNDKGYEFKIVRVQKPVSKEIDQNIKTVQNTVTYSEGAEITTNNRTAQGIITNAEETITYSMDFKASKYNTFSKKINALNSHFDYIDPIRPGVFELGYGINNTELFDDNEIDASGNSKVLKFEAVLSETRWYQNDIFPTQYLGYPFYGRVTWRDGDLLGVPPAKGIYINQKINGLKYTPGSSAPTIGSSSFVYFLSHYMERDYAELQRNVVNMIIQGYDFNSLGRVQDLVTKPFVPIKKGDYKFRVSYVLPGTNVITSSTEINIKNASGNE